MKETLPVTIDQEHMATIDQRAAQDTVVAMLTIAANMERNAQELIANTRAIRAQYAPKRRPFKRRNLVDLVKSQGERR